LLRRKTESCGIVEEAWSRRGTWLDMVRDREDREEFGNEEFHAVLTMRRSRRTMIGGD